MDDVGGINSTLPTATAQTLGEGCHTHTIQPEAQHSETFWSRRGDNTAPCSQAQHLCFLLVRYPSCLMSAQAFVQGCRRQRKISERGFISPFTRLRFLALLLCLQHSLATFHMCSVAQTVHESKGTGLGLSKLRSNDTILMSCLISLSGHLLQK